jgi:hypothetical protein
MSGTVARRCMSSNHDLRAGTGFGSSTLRHREGPNARHSVQTGLTGQEVEPSSRAERRPREGADDGVDCGSRRSFGRLQLRPSRSAPSPPHQVPREHVALTRGRPIMYAASRSSRSRSPPTAVLAQGLPAPSGAETSSRYNGRRLRAPPVFL